MVMILLNKQVVVFLYDQVLVPYDFSLFHFLQQFIVDVGPFFNQSQFSQITMSHSPIEFSLEEKSDHEPVHRDETVSFALHEKHYDRHDDSKGHFENQVHVPEQSKYQLQVHVLQVNNLALRYSVPTFPCYP